MLQILTHILSTLLGDNSSIDLSSPPEGGCILTIEKFNKKIIVTSNIEEKIYFVASENNKIIKTGKVLNEKGLDSIIQWVLNFKSEIGSDGLIFPSKYND